MWVPSENQVSSVLRHVGTGTASAATVLVTFGFLSPDQSAAVIADMKQIVDGLQQAFGGFSKIALIIGPLFATLMATLAAKSSTAASLIATLLKLAHSANTPAAADAKIAIENVVAPALAPTVVPPVAK